MFRTVFSLLGFLSALPLHTQDGIAAGSEDRAAELRQLLPDTPRLPLEPVPLASRLLRAAALGTVSSLAAGRDGVISVLAPAERRAPENASSRGAEPDTVTLLNRRLQRSQSRLQIACRRIITIRAS